MRLTEAAGAAPSKTAAKKDIANRCPCRHTGRACVRARVGRRNLKMYPNRSQHCGRVAGAHVQGFGPKASAPDGYARLRTFSS